MKYEIFLSHVKMFPTFVHNIELMGIFKVFWGMGARLRETAFTCCALFTVVKDQRREYNPLLLMKACILTH